MGVRRPGHAPHYTYRGHEGVFYQHSQATWMYCRTCWLEGSHKRDADDRYHYRHFRLMHERAEQAPYVGRHRRAVLPQRARTM